MSIAFDDKPALIDISFQLHKGEMIFVTGESGSGKSVLLRVAMGLLKPDAEQIFVGNREIETLDESELLAIRGGFMGMVFQEDSLFTGLSVYENVAYRLEEHHWTKQDIQKAVTEVINYSLLMLLPPFRGPGAVIGPGITDDEGFIGVDWAVRVHGVERMYAVGNAHAPP